MSSLVQVIITKIATGDEYEGMALYDNEKYEAIWNEGGLRCVFHFDENGKQISLSNYCLRRSDTPS